VEIWYDENGELNLTPTPKLPRIRSGPRGVGCGSAGGPEEAEATVIAIITFPLVFKL
jgi:hypothetical protein